MAELNLDDWIGRTTSQKDQATSGPIRSLLATFDKDAEIALDEGEIVPPMWHWLLFADDVRQSELGADGHPVRGLLLPPIEGRRMFAGGVTDIKAPLRIGESVTLSSEIAAIEQKEGKTGSLVFVTLHNRITGEGGADVEETKNIVYVDAQPPNSNATKSAVPIHGAGLCEVRSVEFTPTLVFRFSALTFNAHRIHYDLTYATAVEGYRERVVQGPLLALLCLESVSFPVRRFGFRSREPLYVGDTAQFFVTETPEGCTIQVVNSSGRSVMDAKVLKRLTE